MALTRRSQRTRLLVVSLVMASLITITVDFKGGQSGPLELVGQAALSVIGPLQDAVSKTFHPVAEFFGGLARAGSLEAENKRLQDEIARLQQHANSQISTERLYKRLITLNHLEETLGFQGVTARVIGDSVSNFEWSITIDRGSSSGVKVDQPVVTGEGLVGHVVEVALGWSRVELIIDPHSSVAGRLASSGETGLVSGRRSNPMAMDLVNADFKVPPNELVVTSGYQGGLYPAEIPIGFVSNVYAPPGSLTQSILVRPVVDFSSLEVVAVITKSGLPRPHPSAQASPSPEPTPS
jgi:rod shape-determining protein MreC